MGSQNNEEHTSSMQLEFFIGQRSLHSSEMCMLLSMMSVAGVVLEKLTSSFQEVLGRGTKHTSTIVSVQSNEVPTDVYWVKVKVLASLILMCDHSPQHTNSNRRNVVYVCCSVLAILCFEVCNSVVANTKICSVGRSKELDILCFHDVGHAQFCVVMYTTVHVITVCYYNSCCTFTLL